MSRPEHYVYHGSPDRFGVAYPKRQIRAEYQNGKRVVLFDEISFHATPNRGIALVYTYSPGRLIEGTDLTYNVGISLYEDTKTVVIYGVQSLDHSLHKLYERGGYLHVFDLKDFSHLPGLGPLEVAATAPVTPLFIEEINDPVKEMREAGMQFIFIDLNKR